MALLEVNNLTKAFGGVHAVEHCSFSVESRAITALIGPNGAGKTTVFDLISGLVAADAGTVVLGGVDLSNRKCHKRARAGLSRTFQIVRLFKNLTIRDHLFAAMDETDDQFFKSAFRDDLPEFEARAIEVLKRLRLDHELSTPAAELSFGEQKLLDLSRALVKPHQLLMLDEPVAGVNPVLRDKLKHVFKRLKDEGETIFVIEHDMDFVRSVADHLIVMDEGRVLAQGEPEAILANRRVLEAYLGT